MLRIVVHIIITCKSCLFPCDTQELAFSVSFSETRQDKELNIL